MDIADVNNLDWGFRTWSRTRSVQSFFRREADCVRGHCRIWTQAKDCGAKELSRVGGNDHVPQIVCEDGAFASNGSFANVGILHLGRHLAIDHIHVMIFLTPRTTQTSVITSTKAPLPKWARACRTTRKVCKRYEYNVVKYRVKSHLASRASDRVLDVSKDITDCVSFRKASGLNGRRYTGGDNANLDEW